MPLRADTIVETIKTLVTGLATTGANVSRSRVYKLTESQLPALVVIQGEDAADDDDNMSYLTSTLSVVVRAVVQESENYETALNNIRREVHIALMAYVTLGLNYVIKIKSLGASAPTLTDQGAIPVGYIDIPFEVYYRLNLTDPGD